MLTLYYSPGACSLSVHIMLCEIKQSFNVKKVDLAKHTVDDGSQLAAINPKDYVPVLVLENGQVLTEAAAILNYIAPAKGDDLARYKVYEWLTFISSELHKGFGPFFNKNASEDYKTIFRDKLNKRFSYVDTVLSKNEFLTGKEFSAADAYLFTILRWLKFVNTGLSIGSWPNIDAYYKKLSERAAIKTATTAEGIHC